MKQVSAVGVMFLIIFFLAPLATAQWTGCIGCHTGTIASGEEVMKEKFQTVEAFVNAAMASQNPMMKAVQQNKKVLETAARELGLKEAKTPEERPAP